MKNFEYFEPKEVSAAVAFLAKYKGKAKILAGGTDLVPQMKRGIVAPAAVVNLLKIGELLELKESEEGMRIGSMVSLGILETSPLLTLRYPVLQMAIRHVATRPIRNAGTIGGNACLDTKCIYRDQSQTWSRALKPCFKMEGERCYVVRGGKTCHSSLAADTVPVLIALQARARVISPLGEKIIPVETLYTGDGVKPLALTPAEILAEIILPLIPNGAEFAYMRFSLRQAIDFPLVSTAICLEKRNGLCYEARVVLGAVAPRPLRLTQVEAILKTEKITESLLRHCSMKASEEALNISKSGRIDAFTRKTIAHLVYQGLKKAWQSE
jgi:4-hydroxybenzoyl-CoA reductase subunit beta